METSEDQPTPMVVTVAEKQDGISREVTDDSEGHDGFQDLLPTIW